MHANQNGCSGAGTYGVPDCTTRSLAAERAHRSNVPAWRAEQDCIREAGMGACQRGERSKDCLPDCIREAGMGGRGRGISIRTPSPRGPRPHGHPVTHAKPSPSPQARAAPSRKTEPSKDRARDSTCASGRLRVIPQLRRLEHDHPPELARGLCPLTELSHP